MDQQARISFLETTHDWQGLTDELEKGIASDAQNAQKAEYHLRLGQVLEGKFLLGVKALKHFQDAYKLNPQLVDALESARSIYWDLGKLNMVQKLLELELKSVQTGMPASKLLVELGDVLCDGGDHDKATATYARALAASDGQNRDASACLEDVQAESGSWQQQVAALLRAGNEATIPSHKARAFLRASRITRRFAPEEVEGQLAQAYAADPTSRPAAALYEGLLAEQGRLEELEGTQTELLTLIEDRGERAHVAMIFGKRWVQRHQNVDVGARFLEIAIKLDPQHEGAFVFLRDAYGKKGGDWDRVITLAEEAVSHAGENGNATFMLVQAGTIAWREMGNLIRARSSFERLVDVAPEHPQIRAFEAQIGEPLVAASQRAAAPQGSIPPLKSAAPPAMDRLEEEDAPRRVSDRPTGPPPRKLEELVEAVAPEATPAAAPVASEPPPPPAEALVSSPPPALSSPPPAVSSPPPAISSPPPAVSSPPTALDGDEGKIAELRALLDKQEAAKRFNEYVKTLMQLAAIVPSDAEKVELYSKAADLYVTKFSNQAEAVKAYEHVLEIEPDNAIAIEYLRQMYEKRRDWEKLLGLERREAERMDPGPARAQKFLEIAKLATERVKKPDVCIELWNEVIQSDDQNVEALAALSMLYERAKEFEKLAEVLEKQAAVTYDNGQRVHILTKLGTIYGDRLNNDEGAVEAWRALLAIDPNDRKAQEALKKKYLALGRWDDLEVFYSESGKWDEFIRVLEQQEAKEQDPPAKIGLLFKIAQLWADKKQKLDRAAKAYEKILDLEADNLAAAEALIPIYTAANNSKALANAIEVKLGHETDPEIKLGLLREVAALYEGRVKDPARAFERYLSAFEIAPQDEQATADVERAAKATGSWDKLIEAYSHAIDEGDTNPDLVVTLRLKLGRVLVDEVGRIDEALAAYRAVYEADGENGQALAALEKLYRQTSRYNELLEIYEKKRDLALDPTEKKQIQYEIAKLFEAEVKDVDRAIDTYKAVLEDEPQDVDALIALDRLYGQLERWEPYVDVLRKRIELDNAEAELVDLKFRLGTTLEKHTDDAAGALENYREILFVDAQHEGARMALESMLQHPELKSEAAAILESIYEERGDWNKLIEALEILSASETDPSKRVVLGRKVARISAGSLEDYPRAFKALAAALQDDPTMNETRAELEQVVALSDAWVDLAHLYEQIAKGLSDAELARDYWFKVAAIDERLGKVDEAAQGYFHVLSLDAADVEALAALEQLFTRTERWTDLIGVIARRIDQAIEPDAREQLLVQTANIYDEKLENPTEAVSSYRKVLELDPANAR
ncbi:MAG: hypothetical protein ABI551_21485, partial [Polyangiaceae bacterium]